MAAPFIDPPAFQARRTIRRTVMKITDESVDAAKRIRDTAMEQTVAARIPESGHFGAIAQDADWLVDHITAALPHMGGVTVKPLEWNAMDALPQIGSKFIALYDDGSGAGLFFRHDEGFIDQEGDDYSKLGNNFGCWAYLPSGFDLWCESAPEPVQLPYWHGHSLSPSPVWVTDESERKFSLGDRVTKIRGSSWTGRVVGFYCTSLTPIGYAVESDTEIGSVQIYPEAALAGIKSEQELLDGISALSSAGEKITFEDMTDPDALAKRAKMASPHPTSADKLEVKWAITERHGEREKVTRLVDKDAATRIITQQAERIAELEETIRLHKVWDFPADIQALTVRADAAEARIAELVKALEPFARIAEAERYADTPPGSSVIVNVDRCHAARAALGGQSNG